MKNVKNTKNVKNKEKKEKSFRTIQKQVFIEPQFIHKYLDRIYEKLTSDKTFDKNYGYILEIQKKSIKINHNILSVNFPGVVFDVEFLAKTLKPQKGDEYDTQVAMVTAEVLIVKIQGQITTVVPVNKISGYSFDGENKCLKKKDNIIRVGSKIRVVIDSIKYADGKFRCIGSLKMNKKL